MCKQRRMESSVFNPGAVAGECDEHHGAVAEKLVVCNLCKVAKAPGEFYAQRVVAAAHLMKYTCIPFFVLSAGAVASSGNSLAHAG